MLRPANMFLITNQVGLEDALLNGIKVIAITEGNDQIQYKYPNILMASILLPPYEVMSAEIDGLADRANQLYIGYLMTKEPDVFISAVFTALVKGIPVGVYVPEDELELGFVRCLMEYIFNVFGIMIAGGSVRFSYNNTFDHINVCKMYLYDLISCSEFFKLYPDEIPIDMTVINKLVYELNPYIEEGNTLQNYLDYFNQMKFAIKMNANRMLIDPFERGGPNNDYFRT